MKVRWTPKSQQFPALKDKLMVDTFRGQIRVRKWPRKRGKPKSAVTRRMNKWFTDANALAKKLEPTQQNLAIAMTKGTGLYPRDLLLRQMSGGIYDLFTSDGVHLQPRTFFRETKVFQGVILEQTDPQSLPIDTETFLTWQLPVLDTAGFWSAGAPTRITIPTDIDVVALEAGWAAIADPQPNITVISLFKNGVRITRDAVDETGLPSHGTSSGPIVVVAGDFFEVEVFVNKAFTTALGGLTRFNLNVLGAL